MTYRFGDFELDPGRFVLLRNGQPVPIEPRPLRLLLHLLERHPDTVTKDEILDELWQDSAVTEGSITRAVREVRRALQETAEEEGTIRTVRGRGYGIGVDVERVEEDSPTAAEDRDAAAPPGPGAVRRLAAILSADAVGYSKHLARDEHGTIQRVNRARTTMGKIVETGGGRVVDAVGDNLLAEFPSAVAAIEAAVRIQSDIAELDPEQPEQDRLLFRIGLHLGEVLVEDDRIYGDAVNIAARLERLASSGGICASEAMTDALRGKLDLPFQDMGMQPIKGFAQPLRAYRHPVEPAASSSIRAPEEVEKAPEPVRSRPRHRVRRSVFGLLGAFGIVLAAVVLSWPLPLALLLDWFEISGASGPPALPDEPSIVVLPFANLSDEPNQEFFADGIVEDLTTELSRHEGLFVSSRSSAFTYKGRAVNVAEVGRELGVRYVLEGSVRRVGDTVRVTAQLIDAVRDFHVWSGRYDRPFADVLALQSELVEEILPAMAVEIQEAELARIRIKPTDDLAAYELALRGKAHFNRFTRSDNREARRLFERAVSLDPNYATAHAFLGAISSTEVAAGWNLDAELLSEAHQHIRRALALDPDSPFGMTAQAMVLLVTGHHDEAVRFARRATELSPSHSESHFALAIALAARGKLIDAARFYRRGLRLNPHPHGGFEILPGALNLIAGRGDEAAASWEQLRRNNADLIFVRLLLAAHKEVNGSPEEAHVLVKEILAVNPEFRLEAMWAVMPDLQRGLQRAAGLPLFGRYLEALQRLDL